MAGSTLTGFLRAELGPAPGRTPATVRVLVASLVATVLVMSTHTPHGHWIIFTIFTVSPEDAGASLIKGLQRLAGTVAGGGAGMLLAIAFANDPPFLFVAIGLAVALGMFLSRTTSAPYASLLATVTLLMVGVSHLDSPGTEVHTALWRTFMILVGVVLGTGAQVFLWPSDPEERLLDDLGERLEAAERLLQQALAGPPTRPEGPTRPPVLALSGLARELDLLANAEARYPALRRRHTEQSALIGEIERLLTSALWLVEVVHRAGEPPRLDGPARERLTAVAAACRRVRAAIAARQPVTESVSSSGADPGQPPAPGVGIPNLIAHMETTIRRIAAATAFLGSRGEPRPGESGHSPLDTPARAPFFTAAFSLANTEDMKFALKCALAVEICFVLILGFDWPGLLTSAITCVIVAQSTLGASAYKALLRLAGAVVGGLLGLIVIVAVMPNAQSLASLLLPIAACFWIAAWVTAGSSRISYAGVQVGMAIGICVLDVFGPTTNLVLARDRVLGIMLGIAVMGLVYELIWPVRAGRAMRPALASALRAMAPLADIPPAPRAYAAAIARAARDRVSVYRALASVLRLREEALTEPGAFAPEPRAERDRVLELTGDAQGVFLALLALARHRLTRTAQTLPAILLAPLTAFDRDVRQTLEATAVAVESPTVPDRGTSPPLPARGVAGPSNTLPADLEGRLAELERTAALAGDAGAAATAFLQGEISIRREVVQEVGRLARALRTDHQAHTAA